ncbi:hypothetical protein BN13_910017 [Nostocoides jenkinsii Ben 74]|uniref:Uncharacterized protein n=1 Tax=Nostocoides jenkinsii Ben 74 TaxID=1193518 RepID=A0A077MCF7_9MICO|nr:hypothetical protein BN13_910017 [Tetrasphaera jenkinsii Ben 74]
MTCGGRNSYCVRQVIASARGWALVAGPGAALGSAN